MVQGTGTLGGLNNGLLKVCNYACDDVQEDVAFMFRSSLIVTDVA